MLNWDRVAIWVAAICTLAIYSFLYRENKVYRFFEHVFMGLAGGYGVVITWTQVLKPNWWDPMTASFKNLIHPEPGKSAWGCLWILAFFLGILWYFIYSKKYVWLSRVVIGLFLGTGAGVTFKSVFGATMPQIYATFKPFLIPHKPLTSINNFIYLSVVVCVMTYFFFSVEHKYRLIRGGAKLGRWCLMVAFGAFFGNTVMARMSLFIERFQFLLIEWLKLGK